MDFKIEEEILQKFFKKNDRERIIYELKNPEKRFTGICKICSPQMARLKPSIFVPIDRKIWISELIELLKGKGAQKEVYIMSIEFVGKVSLEEGVDFMFKETGTLLYCGDGLGCFRRERFPFCGTAQMFLLVSK